MSFKKWIFIFSASFMIMLVPALIFNYIINPYGYFRPKDYHKISNFFERLTKPSYIAAHPKKYSCIIIGGSNAGFLRTKTVEELTGYACFNSFVSSGFFDDYLAFVDYYISTMPNLKEIIINISNNEIEFEHRDIDYQQLPSYFSGKRNLRYSILFLMKSPFTIFEKIIFQKNEPSFGIESDNYTGEQPYEPTDDYDIINEKVLQHNNFEEENFESRIHNLCTTEKRNFPYYNESLIYLQKIKELCESNNIKLTIFIGAVFISKKEWFESNEFYNWLRQISKITEFYDFSGFYDINKNPYNFYDANHFNKTLGDKILRIVYGKEQCTDFGIKVTQENVEKYLLQRRKDYEKIKEEYQRTGTIKLFDKTHSSYVKE